MTQQQGERFSDYYFVIFSTLEGLEIIEIVLIRAFFSEARRMSPQFWIILRDIIDTCGRGQRKHQIPSSSMLMTVQEPHVLEHFLRWRKGFDLRYRIALCLVPVLYRYLSLSTLRSTWRVPRTKLERKIPTNTAMVIDDFVTSAVLIYTCIIKAVVLGFRARPGCSQEATRFPTQV